MSSNPPVRDLLVSSSPLDQRLDLFEFLGEAMGDFPGAVVRLHRKPDPRAVTYKRADARGHIRTDRDLAFHQLVEILPAGIQHRAISPTVRCLRSSGMISSAKITPG